MLYEYTVHALIFCRMFLYRGVLLLLRSLESRLIGLGSLGPPVGLYSFSCYPLYLLNNIVSRAMGQGTSRQDVQRY